MVAATKVEADAQGLLKYFTGKPCRRGHVAERYAASRNCVACLSEDAKKPERVAQAKVRSARYYQENRSKLRLDNNLAVWLYAKNNPDKVRANTRLQQAKRRKRVPAWADLEAIRAFYKACPPGMQVDHIVPLQGKLVCGLHVENNLQYLTPEANKAKGNRF